MSLNHMETRKTRHTETADNENVQVKKIQVILHVEMHQNVKYGLRKSYTVHFLKLSTIQIF